MPIATEALPRTFPSTRRASRPAVALRDRAGVGRALPGLFCGLSLGIAVIVVMLPVAATAENSPARKLGRGAANFGLGVMAIPSEIIDTTREHGPTLGVTWGLIKGTGMFVATEAVGLFEMMTCPFATPPDYAPILSPEYPWQRFTEEKPERTARKVRTATAGGRRAQE